MLVKFWFECETERDKINVSIIKDMPDLDQAIAFGRKMAEERKWKLITCDNCFSGLGRIEPIKKEDRKPNWKDVVKEDRR